MLKRGEYTTLHIVVSGKCTRLPSSLKEDRGEECGKLPLCSSIHYVERLFTHFPQCGVERIEVILKNI
jgi:hypothetical protein